MLLRVPCVLDLFYCGYLLLEFAFGEAGCFVVLCVFDCWYVFV